VVDSDSIEREGSTGKTRDPLRLEGLIAGQAPEKCRGTPCSSLHAERILHRPDGLNDDMNARRLGSIQTLSGSSPPIVAPAIWFFYLQPC